MKKIIKIISLLLLCFSFSSCTTYEYVKLSEQQQSDIKENLITALGYKNEFDDDPYIEEFSVFFSMYQDMSIPDDKCIYYVDMNNNSLNDYYLCAYLSNDIKELITSKTPEDYQGEVDAPWLDYFDEQKYDGYNNYLKYYYLISVIDKQYIYKEYPIQWYEIKKGEKIPEEIDDTFLVFVGETYTLKFYDCEKKIETNKIVIEENKEVYSNLKNTKKVKNVGLFNGEYMIIDLAELFNHDYIMSSTLKTAVNYFSFKCEEIDNEKYVLINGVPCLFYGYRNYLEDDLRDLYKYFKKDNSKYLFRFIDIWELFTKQSEFIDYDNYKGYYEEPREVVVKDAIVLDVYENGECLLLWNKDYIVFDKLENPKIGDRYNITFEVETVLQIEIIPNYHSGNPTIKFDSKYISSELISSIEEKEGMNFIQYVCNGKNGVPGYYLDEIIYYETGTLLTDAVSSYISNKQTTLSDYFLRFEKYIPTGENIEKYTLEGKYLTYNLTVYQIED